VLRGKGTWRHTRLLPVVYARAHTHAQEARASLEEEARRGGTEVPDGVDGVDAAASAPIAVGKLRGEDYEFEFGGTVRVARGRVGTIRHTTGTVCRMSYGPYGGSYGAHTVGKSP
jgi:hypothetical protein